MAVVRFGYGLWVQNMVRAVPVFGFGCSSVERGFALFQFSIDINRNPEGPVRHLFVAG